MFCRFRTLGAWISLVETDGRAVDDGLTNIEDQNYLVVSFHSLLSSSSRFLIMTSEALLASKHLCVLLLYTETCTVWMGSQHWLNCMSYTNMMEWVNLTSTCMFFLERKNSRGSKQIAQALLLQQTRNLTSGVTNNTHVFLILRKGVWYQKDIVAS